MIIIFIIHLFFLWVFNSVCCSLYIRIIIHPSIKARDLDSFGVNREMLSAALAQDPHCKPC